jgi:hypothetical protein
MGKPEVISSPVGWILRGTSPICTQTIADGSAIIMPLRRDWRPANVVQYHLGSEPSA